MATTPLMGLELLESGLTSTEDLLRTFNDNMSILDRHTHQVGSGALIPTSAVRADSDLRMNNNLSLQLKATGYNDNREDSLINASAYFKNGELFIRDGSGTVVQITNNGRLTTQTTAVSETTSLLFGYSGRQATLSQDPAVARAAAVASAGVTLNRNSKVADSIRSGSRVDFLAPGATGYYFPWLAVRIADLETSTIFYDADDYSANTDWVVADANTTIDGASYRLFVRRLPLAQNESYGVVVRAFR